MATQSGRILRGALDRIVSSSANYWVAMLSDLRRWHFWPWGFIGLARFPAQFMAPIADPRILTLQIWVISGDRLSRSSATDIIGLPAAAS